MHQQHPKRRFGRQLRQDLVERIELCAAKPARRHQRRRRHRRRDADQRQRAAPADKRIRRHAGLCIAAQIVGECPGKAMPGGAHIGVVIAGDDRDLLRRADAFQPGRRRRELRLQREIDEIAGDRDVVRLLRLEVGDQRVEHVAAVIFVPVAGPVEIAEPALAGEIAQPRRWQRRKMRVGQMRQRERGHQLRPPGSPVI